MTSPPCCLHRGGEEVAVVVAEGVVGVDHRDLLAEVRRHPGGHRLHLALHVGDAGLQRPAVERAGGDVVALGADEVGHAQLAGARGRAHDDVGEEGAEDQVHVLGGELLDHLGAALGVGAVVLEDDLDRAAVDAAGVVQHLERGGGGALVPAAVGGADAGAVQLEAEADRLGGLRLDPARPEAGGGQRGSGREALQHIAPPGRADPFDGHGTPPLPRRAGSPGGARSEACGKAAGKSTGLFGARPLRRSRKVTRPRREPACVTRRAAGPHPVGGARIARGTGGGRRSAELRDGAYRSSGSNDRLTRAVRRRWRWRGARGRRRCRRPSARSSAGGRGAARGRRGGGRGRRRAGGRRGSARTGRSRSAVTPAGSARKPNETQWCGRPSRLQPRPSGSLSAAIAYWPSVSSATR